MNVLFKTRNCSDTDITTRSKHRPWVNRHSPVLRLFFISLTNVPFSNYSKVYFHFYMPRLRKHISLKGFSHTVSEMAFQKKGIFGSHDVQNTFGRLANKHANKHPQLHATRFRLLQLLQSPFPLPPNSEQSTLPFNWLWRPKSFLKFFFFFLPIWEQRVIAVSNAANQDTVCVVREVGKVCCYPAACKWCHFTNTPALE